jgi:hypothetical protein
MARRAADRGLTGELGVRKRMLAGLLAGGMLMVPSTVMARPACTISGTSGDDVFGGSCGLDEIICGLGGDDTIEELAGAIFRGGPGREWLASRPGVGGGRALPRRGSQSPSRLSHQ